MEADHDLGLVLSGGGAKGVAHIGVLKAMEERNIKPSIVAGTSAGAIVGSLYCAGYSPDEMFEFFTTTSVFRPAYYTWKKPGFFDSQALNKVLLEKFKENTFESLDKPLYIVATDITAARQKVFSRGELVKPILASSSFPVLFAPIEIEESLFADGGILNNFPTEPIRQQCKKLIGVNVQHISPTDKSKLKNVFNVFQRIYSISTRFSSVAKYQECDLVIAPHKLNDFNTFDMYKLKKMYDIGYEEACKIFDELENLDDFKNTN